MEFFGEYLKTICCWGLGMCLAALFLAVVFAPVWENVRKWLSQTFVEKVLVAVFAVGIILYGGTKGGYSWRITYEGGIKAGTSENLVTNDTVVVYWQRDTSEGVYIPESSAVYIDCRPNTATNEEWVLLAQTTVGAWSWTGTVENATNYDYNVWAYYIPPEPVHTNGVWTYKTHFGRNERYAIPLRARIELNGKAIATPKEVRKDEEKDD